MKLFPRLPLFEDESTRSWIERMTAFHGAPSVATFNRQLGINGNGLVYGDDGAIMQLGSLTGEDPALIRRNLLSKVRKSSALTLGGRNFTPFLHPYDARHVCRRCLAEDAQEGPAAFHARERWEWHFRTTKSCSRHGSPLVDPGPSVNDWRFTGIALHGSDVMLDEEEPSPLHLWLMQNVQQEVGIPSLGLLNFNCALDAMATFGRIICCNEATGDAVGDRDRHLNAGAILLQADLAELEAVLKNAVRRHAAQRGLMTNTTKQMLRSLSAWEKSHATLGGFEELGRIVKSAIALGQHSRDHEMDMLPGLNLA